MRFKTRSIAFYILLFAVSLNLSAQYKDFRSWWSLDLAYSFSSDFSAGLEASQRFDQNSLSYDRSLLTLGLQYEILKDLTLEGAYRHVIFKDSEDGFQSKFRVHTSLKYVYDLSMVQLDIRNQLQYGFDEFNSLGIYYDNKLINRTRLRASHDIFGSPFELQGSFEYFLQLNTGFGVLPVAYRLKAGVEYKLNMKTDLSVNYMLENEMNVRNPLQSHILSVGLSYDL